MNDKVSALLDGDLDDQSSSTVLDSMRRDESLQRKWQEYCLIGDALRGDAVGSLDFTERVMAGLSDEPTILAPRPPATAERTWVRALMPIAASLMGVVAVGWVASTISSQPQGGVAVAGTSGSPRVDVLAPRIETVAVQVDPLASPGARDEAHREYMFVHQAMNGGGMIPGAVHYVRTVSDTRGDLRR